MKGLSFSLKRAVGISGLKAKVAHKVGVPTTKQGLERKVGQTVLSALIGGKNANNVNNQLTPNINPLILKQLCQVKFAFTVRRKTVRY